MSNSKSFTEKTNADTKEIGFHYQYYYFLYQVLNLKLGQSVGLEIKDDVHTELDNDNQILFQLKHTLQKNSAGDPIALTELDSDLWKTLYNWAKIIADESVGRNHVLEQISFINRTEFHLVTNKSESHRNFFVKKIEDFKILEVSYEDIRSYIESLSDNTKDINLKKYMKAVLDLERRVFCAFIGRINFQLNLDDLHRLIKQSIREKMVENNKVDDVFERLDSNIRADNYIQVKQGEKIELSFDSFYSRYRNIFSTSRQQLQIGKPFEPAYPDDVFAQIFIKQLVNVKAIKLDDHEKAFEYTGQKLKIVHFLDEWFQNGELLSDEIEEFHRDVHYKWRNGFEHWCEDCLDNEVSIKAKSLLYDLRQKEFYIANSKLNTELSNGEIYYLSDEKVIGWHRDWKEL